MRLLIDANLSPKVAAALRKAGLESVHVGDVGLLTAPDRAILDYAAANALVIVSADSDFGELLAAARGATRPSVVLLRSADRLTSDQQAALLAANLPAAADDLEAGAIVTIARGRMRIRALPIVAAGDHAALELLDSHAGVAADLRAETDVRHASSIGPRSGRSACHTAAATEVRLTESCPGGDHQRRRSHASRRWLC